MMTLMARLCALCAVSALMELALGDADEAGGVRMIGGLLMLRLVLYGAQDLAAQLSAQRDLATMLHILLQ